MAFIRFKNNKGIVVSAEQGVNLWRVFTGSARGNKAQRDFVKTVKAVYLNPSNAPKDYLEWRRQRFQVAKPPQQIRLPYAD